METPLGSLGLVYESQHFKIFFAKHNLSSFKFSAKVKGRGMLVNTPFLSDYGIKRTFNRHFTDFNQYYNQTSKKH